MPCSCSSPRNISFDLLLCPIVHIVACSADFDVLVGFCCVFKAVVHPLIVFPELRHVDLHSVHVFLVDDHSLYELPYFYCT